MAFSQLEPFGSHIEDLRAGTIATMLGNINRNAKVAPEPFGLLDFIPWNDSQTHAEKPEPILLDDAKAQSDLIKSMMFPKRE